VSAHGTTSEIVTSGGARDGEFPAQGSRAARLEAAFLFPVAHDTTLRFALGAGSAYPDIETARLPRADQVARGWRAQLDRGMRVELPDVSLQNSVDTARAQLLLAGSGVDAGSRRRRRARGLGNDSEARSAWARLGILARRKAGRRARAARRGTTFARARVRAMRRSS